MMLRNGRWQMMVEQLYTRTNTPAEKRYIALEQFTLGKIPFEEVIKVLM